MRQDAFRSLELQSLSVIPGGIAGHGEIGNMAELDRALSRWLAKQPAERNQRVGFARRGVFTLAAPISEEEYIARNLRSNRRRAARKLGLSEAEYLVARDNIEAQRLAVIKATREAGIAARIAALPKHLAEAFQPLDPVGKSTYNLKQAEWVATLPEEEQRQILEKRVTAQLAKKNR